MGSRARESQAKTKTETERDVTFRYSSKAAQLEHDHRRVTLLQMLSVDTVAGFRPIFFQNPQPNVP